MHPTLIELGPIPLYSYGFMMMIGFLVSVHVAARRARRCGADEEFTLNIGLLSLIVGVIGARLFYVVHYLPAFLSARNPLLAIVDITSGGLEFYGGFLSAVVATLVYIRMKNRSIRWYLDILAPSIMLGLAFGRIGCFLNGCCWGTTTRVPWAIRFPYGSLAFEHQAFKTHELKVPGEFLLIQADGTPSLMDRKVLAMSDDQFQKALQEADPKSRQGMSYGKVNAHL